MSEIKENLLFVCPNLSKFIKADIKLLQTVYNVTVSQYDWGVKWLTPYFMIKQIVYILFNLRSVDKIVVSFGGYWAFFPALLGKVFNIPIFIILHGTDCASIPSIGYGSLRSPIRKYFMGLSYGWATKLLPVSASLINIDNQYYIGGNENRQGFKYFFPNMQSKAEVVFNGLDSSFWKTIASAQRKENSFVTVFSKNQFVLKGGDLILEVAKLFPNYTFYFVGLEKPEHIESLGKNVFFLGRKTQKEMVEIFNGTSYYIQLSIFEGFGMSLCEAMLCGCIPIGSNVNVIPEIIGDSGFIVEERSEKALANAISECVKIADQEDYRKKARSRINDNYDIRIREMRLVECIAC